MAITGKNLSHDLPVTGDPSEFDPHSGMWTERLVFNFRPVVLVLCLLFTGFFGWHALKLPISASFDKMIPQSHPYIQQYFENKDRLGSMSNSLRIVVENTRGDIFDEDYLLTLQKINDIVYLTRGVDRAWMRGLWTSSLRWTEVTEEGYAGGPVMPRWDGSPEVIAQLKLNVARAGLVGSFVGDDLRSSMIFVPLLEFDPETGESLDYRELGRTLEREVRALESDSVRIHIIGFAKLVSDLIEGLHEVLQFFAVSALIASVFVFLYSRCLSSTVLLVSVALIGVVWQLGLMQLLGFVLDPYSILVPFLVFTVGLSHGAQKMNGIMRDIGRGVHKYVAARYTFRRLFMAGLAALLTNIAGFAVLAVIDIPVIRDLAITTSMGVGVLILTKLILMPVLLSYVGVSCDAAKRSAEEATRRDGFSYAMRSRIVRLTSAKPASWMVLAAAVLVALGIGVSRDIQFGDLDAGAPELWPDSRYNRDNAYVTSHYGLSTDQFVVLLKTPLDGCWSYPALVEADRLGAVLRQTAGVQSVFSAADGVRQTTSVMFEGNPDWLTIPRAQSIRALAFTMFTTERPDLGDRTCAVTPIIAYLADHKATTLAGVVSTVERFAAEHNTEERQFLLAAGNAGIDAVTNIVVRQSFWVMHLLLFGAMSVLCFIAFRSWRAVLVALIPLAITSVLSEALMVLLGIGIKVATLPVIALGVGMGVDYALYLLSVQLALQRYGATLKEAYRESLAFVGRIVILIGCTMTAGVITWAWSPIKFQADMGLLLAFMLLWNMIGALLLIPALSYFLLRTDADRAPVPAPVGDAPTAAR